MPPISGPHKRCREFHQAMRTILNERVVAPLAKYTVSQEAERSCVRYLPLLATADSFNGVCWIEGFAYAPRD